MAAIPTVDYYQTRNGRRPFREWLEALRDKSAKARIDARIADSGLGSKETGNLLVKVLLNFGSITAPVIASTLAKMGAG